MSFDSDRASSRDSWQLAAVLVSSRQLSNWPTRCMSSGLTSFCKSGLAAMSSLVMTPVQAFRFKFESQAWTGPRRCPGLPGSSSIGLANRPLNSPDQFSPSSFSSYLATRCGIPGRYLADPEAMSSSRSSSGGRRDIHLSRTG